MDRWAHPLRVNRVALPILVLVVAASAEEPATVKIPDGTAVTLRFATSLYTKPLSEHSTVPRVGDSVRLVAAGDVRVHGDVVIARGARAQATITRADPPSDPTSRDCSWKNEHDPCHRIKNTGISLQMDWVEAVDGSRIRIRPDKKGKKKSFAIEVFPKGPGFEARPEKLSRDILSWRMLDPTTLSATLHEMKKRLGVPVGTRILTYVHGETELPLDEVKAAQVKFPGSNDHAILTFYRLKGRGEEAAALFNENQKIVDLGQEQYIALDLAAGKYMFRVADEKPIEIELQGGLDYYMCLRPKKLSGGWELKLMDVAEAEDDLVRADAKLDSGALSALVKKHQP